MRQVGREDEMNSSLVTWDYSTTRHITKTTTNFYCRTTTSLVSTVRPTGCENGVCCSKTLRQMSALALTERRGRTSDSGSGACAVAGHSATGASRRRSASTEQCARRCSPAGGRGTRCTWPSTSSGTGPRSARAHTCRMRRRRQRPARCSSRTGLRTLQSSVSHWLAQRRVD